MQALHHNFWPSPLKFLRLPVSGGLRNAAGFAPPADTNRPHPTKREDRGARADPRAGWTLLAHSRPNGNIALLISDGDGTTGKPGSRGRFPDVWAAKPSAKGLPHA